MYKYIIPFLIIIVVIIIVTRIIMIFEELKREKRIANFALSRDDFKKTSFFDSISELFWKIIHKLSNKLGSNSFFRSLATNYEKYILIREETYKSSLDYVTVKILFIFIFGLIYGSFVLSSLFPFNIFVLIVFFIVGYIVPDIFWRISYFRKCQHITNRLYESIIIIDDSLKNTTIYKSIKKITKELDGAVADEYERILIDLSFNLTLYQAFKRFYDRTKISEIRNIYHLLRMEAGDEETFNEIRRNFSYLKNVESIRLQTKVLVEVIATIALLVPAICVLIISIVDINYFSTLFSSPNGILLFYAFLIIYFIFIYIFKKIVEVIK